MRLRRFLPVLFLLPLAPALAAASPAGVDTLAVLEQRVAFASDGDAVLTVTAVLATAGPALALLPFGYERADSFRIAGRDAAFPVDDAGALAPLRRSAARARLVVALGPAAAAGDTVIVQCRLPGLMDWEGARGEFAAYDAAGTLVNDSDLDIGTCRLSLVVPPGYRVRRVTGTEPAFKPTVSPVPPYAVSRIADRGLATVTAKRLRPGGRVHIGIQAERVHRGPVPLVAGIVIVLLYLWFFRDILPARRAAAPAAPAPGGDR
jgi:hypothetical protein